MGSDTVSPMDAGRLDDEEGRLEKAPVEAEEDATEEPWPADEAPTDEAGEWVKPCGCPGGWNEHSLTCPEVQNYL
jgi:hypothetical protein